MAPGYWRQNFYDALLGRKSHGGGVVSPVSLRDSQGATWIVGLGTTPIKMNKYHISPSLLLIAGLAFPTALFGGSSSDYAAEFKAMDRNGDGKISPEEHATQAKSMFETMDTNKDGIVTAAEMEASHSKITGRKEAKTEMTAAEKIKAIDTNADGMLSAAEHANGAKSMFQKMDTDGDGYLTLAEFEAGHKKTLHKAAN